VDKIDRIVKASEATQIVADNIFAKVNALLVLTETGGTLLATGGEDNLYINNAPSGVYEPHTILLDLDNMAVGDADVTVIKVYYRLTPAGGLQLFDYQSYTGTDGGLTDSKKLIAIDLLPNRFGVKVTLTQTAGVMKNYDWNILARI
jgi:hypothetical protein